VAGERNNIKSKRTLKTEQDLRTAVKGSKNLKPFENIVQHPKYFFQTGSTGFFGLIFGLFVFS
jgi:hypothetical protein